MNPTAVQSLILEHERQHMLARDPLLLRAGILLVMLVPWNLPLWWQLRRLRLAIELDCDARVLGSGADAIRYAEVLLGVVRRVTTVPVGVVAMSEPRIGAGAAHTQSAVRPAALRTAGSDRRRNAGDRGRRGNVPARCTGDFPAGQGCRQGTRGGGTGELVRPRRITAARIATAGHHRCCRHRGGEPTVHQRMRNPLWSRHRQLRAHRSRRACCRPRLASIPDEVLGALVRKYPEIIAGAERPGIIEAAIVLKQDGTVHRSALRQPQDPDVFGRTHWWRSCRGMPVSRRRRRSNRAALFQVAGPSSPAWRCAISCCRMATTASAPMNSCRRHWWLPVPTCCCPMAATGSIASRCS